MSDTGLIFCILIAWTGGMAFGYALNTMMREAEKLREGKGERE